MGAYTNSSLLSEIRKKVIRLQIVMTPKPSKGRKIEKDILKVIAKHPKLALDFVKSNIAKKKAFNAGITGNGQWVRRLYQVSKVFSYEEAKKITQRYCHETEMSYGGPYSTYEGTLDGQTTLFPKEYWYFIIHDYRKK